MKKKNPCFWLVLAVWPALLALAACGTPSGAANFNTNLENLRGQNGTWRETRDGLYSWGSSDSFAMSQSSGDSFVYSATVAFGQGSGAGSLVFRSNASGSSAYVANVDRTAGTCRIFMFRDGQHIGDLMSAQIPSNKDSYELRAEALGSRLAFFVDGVLIGSATDDTYHDGYFGLLTWNTQITYQDVLLQPVDMGLLPVLSSLEVSGGQIRFDPNSRVYSVQLPSGQESVTVTATAPADHTLTLSAANHDGSVSVEERAMASGTASEGIPVASGEYTTISVRVANADNPAVTTVVQIYRQPNLATAYLDVYRPHGHFTPIRNFMNDPNGLVYDTSSKTWLQFFQYNPSAMNIGNQVWGQARSADLVHWEEGPIAIPQGDGLGAIFSGSAVVDEQNTSGFFTDNKLGQSRLVAIFTHDGGDTTYGVEKQSIAYSTDHGMTWTLYNENPVIRNENNVYGRDFRDPKVFRHDGRWLMVVAGGAARLFSSSDLRTWTHESNILYQNGEQLYSECPDLFPLTAPDGSTKWIYTAAGAWYIIGDLRQVNNRYTFVPETDRMPFSAGSGYATQTYYNDGTGQGRVLAVSWLVDFHRDLPEKKWMGAQSFAHELTLIETNGQLRLSIFPAREINALQGDLLFETKDFAVIPGTENILSDIRGRYYDIMATVNTGNAKEIGFNLHGGNGQRIQVLYNTTNIQFITNRRGFLYDGTNGTGEILSTNVQPRSDGTVSFRIIMDGSVLEAFGNNGEASYNFAFFGNSGNDRMEFFVNGGDARIVDMQIYALDSMHTIPK